MRIYLAGSWNRKEQLAGYASDLKEADIEVTSRWLTSHDETVPPDIAAKEDLEDIDSAEIVVSFTETPAAGYLTGGRHVEFGYGLAKGKKMIIVGSPENVFHNLDAVMFFPIWEDAKLFLATMKLIKLEI